MRTWVAQCAGDFGQQGFCARELAFSSRQPIADVGAWIDGELAAGRVSKVTRGRRGPSTVFRSVVRRTLPRPRRVWA